MNFNKRTIEAENVVKGKLNSMYYEQYRKSLQCNEVGEKKEIQERGGENLVLDLEQERENNK